MPDVVPIKEYVDALRAADAEAVRVALNAVKESVEKDARHLRTWLTVVGIAVTVALGLLVKHA